MGLLNPGGPIAQFKRNRCSISPVELILQSGVRSLGCLELRIGGDVGVSVQREACRVVAKHTADGFHVHAVLERIVAKVWRRS